MAEKIIITAIVLLAGAFMVRTLYRWLSGAPSCCCKSAPRGCPGASPTGCDAGEIETSETDGKRSSSCKAQDV